MAETVLTQYKVKLGAGKIKYDCTVSAVNQFYAENNAKSKFIERFPHIRRDNVLIYKCVVNIH